MRPPDRCRRRSVTHCAITEARRVGFRAMPIIRWSAPHARRFASCLLWRVSAGVACVAFSATAPADSVKPDERLSTRVFNSQDFSMSGEELADYLGRLTESTKVEHRAKSPFDRNPVIALSADGTVGKLQRLLARTYHLTWVRSSTEAPTYALLLSKADRQLRADTRAGVIRKGRALMSERLERVRKMALLDPEQLRRVAAQGDPKARNLLHPRTGAMARLVFQLP
ncbi:MAG: hypothetical protein K0Q72_2657, partial [Armatimonadetes bacterium]|nr:hypothetical protein [Armatimonadota bacterium]